MRNAADMLTNVANGLAGPMLPGIVPDHVEEYREVVDTLEDTTPTPTPEADVTPVPTPEVDTTPLPTPETVQVDSRGMAWDERIHASTKTCKANGEWKNKRGVDKDLLAQVEAELLGYTGNDPESENDTVSIPEVPAATPPVVTPPEDIKTGKIENFSDLMSRITKAKIHPDKTQQVVTQMGVASVALLAGRPELFDAVAEALEIA